MIYYLLSRHALFYSYKLRNYNIIEFIPYIFGFQNPTSHHKLQHDIRVLHSLWRVFRHRVDIFYGTFEYARVGQLLG